MILLNRKSLKTVGYSLKNDKTLQAIYEEPSGAPLARIYLFDFKLNKLDLKIKEIFLIYGKNNKTNRIRPRKSHN
jgi:hypothetical protein